MKQIKPAANPLRDTKNPVLTGDENKIQPFKKDRNATKLSRTAQSRDQIVLMFSRLKGHSMVYYIYREKYVLDKKLAAEILDSCTASRGS